MVSRHLGRGRRRLWAVVGAVAAGSCATVLASGAPAASSATPIKIGILSTCQGPFAPFYPETTAGARTALIQLAGGKAAGTGATSQVKGAQIGGHPIKLVYGCSNAQPDGALKGARRLGRQVKGGIPPGPAPGG